MPAGGWRDLTACGDTLRCWVFCQLAYEQTLLPQTTRLHVLLSDMVRGYVAI